ncbi:MAG TPA: RNA-binding S4 domain-containing protein [Gemmatimonadaceae bacterium]|nr:RNA-binding S4 domain-containing protein [Gemmatimonadaceae bacterium]
MSSPQTPDARTRLDKWLWAARFYKTRSLAADAVEQGRVEVNGDRAKRAKAIAPGDTVRIRQPPFETVCVVRAISDRRGPASEAAKLYEETDASRAARAALAAQLRAAPPPDYETGRPSKKDRRDIERWERRRRDE